MQATITLRLAISQRIDRYSQVSASDCQNRHPKRWELWAQRAKAPPTQWEQIHSVSSAKFPGFWEQVAYDLTDSFTVGVLFSAVQLRITASQKAGEGIHLAQFFLSSKSLRVRKKTNNDANGSEDQVYETTCSFFVHTLNAYLHTSINSRGSRR